MALSVIKESRKRTYDKTEENFDDGIFALVSYLVKGCGNPCASVT